MKKWLAVIIVISLLLACAAPAWAADISGLSAVIDDNKLVTVSGILSTGAGQVVSVRILDPQGNVEYAGSMISTSFGNIRFSYTMTNSTPGTYEVSVSALGLAAPVKASFQYGVNNDLKDLTISSGGFDKAFSPGTTAYAVRVDSTVKSVTLTPTVKDKTAGVTVNNEAVTSGAASKPIALKDGDNPISVTVKALSGSIKTYTVTVNRPALYNTTLEAQISVNTDKRVAINGKVSTGAGQQVSVMVTDPQGNLDYVNNTTSTSGGSYQVTYTLTNTMTGRYTVSLGALGLARPVKKTFDVEPALQNLALNNCSLIPSFKSDVIAYTASVSSSVNSVAVTPTAVQGCGTITVNTKEVTSGRASAPITLNTGVTLIEVTVKSQDGLLSKTYSITMEKILELPAGNSIQAQIDKDKRVTVSGTLGSTAGQQISVMVADPKGQTDYVNSTQTAAGGSFELAYTMSNTETGRYSVSVGALALVHPALTHFLYDPGSADLDSLIVEDWILEPQFSPAQTSYSASVEFTTNTARILASTVDPNATVQINGQSTFKGSLSYSTSLDIGANTFQIVVTAVNGKTQTYTLNVFRIGPTPEQVGGDSSDDNPPSNNQGQGNNP